MKGMIEAAILFGCDVKLDDDRGCCPRLLIVPAAHLVDEDEFLRRHEWARIQVGDVTVADRHVCAAHRGAVA